MGLRPAYHRVAYGEQELELMVQSWFAVDVADADAAAASAYDIVVAGLGAPHDADLLGVSRAAAQIRFAPPRVRAGGAIIVPARLDRSDERELEAGILEQLALTRRDCLVIVAASEAPEVVSRAGLRAAVDVEEGLDLAYAHLGQPPVATVLIVPRLRLRSGESPDD